jgi:hypothetical protein
MHHQLCIRILKKAIVIGRPRCTKVSPTQHASQHWRMYCTMHGASSCDSDQEQVQMIVQKKIRMMCCSAGCIGGSFSWTAVTADTQQIWWWATARHGNVVQHYPSMLSKHSRPRFCIRFVACQEAACRSATSHEPCTATSTFHACPIAKPVVFTPTSLDDLQTDLQRVDPAECE